MAVIEKREAGLRAGFFICQVCISVARNEAFVKLLENEGLSTMPEYLWSKLTHPPKIA